MSLPRDWKSPATYTKSLRDWVGLQGESRRDFADVAGDFESPACVAMPRDWKSPTTYAKSLRDWVQLELIMAPYTQLFVHCVWATFGRLPLIKSEYESVLYSAMIMKCKELGCHVLAIGGIEDHVHVLTSFPAALALSQLLKEVKGSSSHLMNHDAATGEAFKWQGGYGVFSVSKRSIETVSDYIRNQKSRHASGQLITDLERVDDEL